jgi:hypothetical protein
MVAAAEQELLTQARQELLVEAQQEAHNLQAQQEAQNLQAQQDAENAEHQQANAPWLGQRWRTGVNGGSGLPLEVVEVKVYSGISIA